VNWHHRRPASKSKKKPPKFASLVFEWGSQVAADPALERQTLANRLVRPIQHEIRETDGLAQLNQVVVAGQLSATARGVQKALGKLIARGHLRLARCRKSDGRPNLYEPLLGGLNLSIELVRRGTNSEGTGYELRVRTDSLPSTFSQGEIDQRKRWTRHQLAKHHTKATVAAVERDLGAEAFSRLALAGVGDGIWSLSAAEIVRFGRGLPSGDSVRGGADLSTAQSGAGRPDARGRHMLLVQQWGRLTELEAQALVNDWYSRVQPQTIKDAFAGAEKRTRGPVERMEWLEAQISAAMRDPGYRVPTRSRHSTDGRAVRELVRAFEQLDRDELSVAEIAHVLSHITRETVRNRLSKALSSGEIEQAAYGRYRLRSAAR